MTGSIDGRFHNDVVYHVYASIYDGRILSSFGTCKLPVTPLYYDLPTIMELQASPPLELA
jgi:hypothetical protein